MEALTGWRLTNPEAPRDTRSRGTPGGGGAPETVVAAVWRAFRRMG